MIAKIRIELKDDSKIARLVMGVATTCSLMTAVNPLCFIRPPTLQSHHLPPGGKGPVSYWGSEGSIV